MVLCHTRIHVLHWSPGMCHGWPDCPCSEETPVSLEVIGGNFDHMCRAPASGCLLNPSLPLIIHSYGLELGLLVSLLSGLVCYQPDLLQQITQVTKIDKLRLAHVHGKCLRPLRKLLVWKSRRCMLN